MSASQETQKPAPKWTEAELRDAKELILLLAKIDARRKQTERRKEA